MDNALAAADAYVWSLPRLKPNRNNLKTNCIISQLLIEFTTLFLFNFRVNRFPRVFHFQVLFFDPVENYNQGVKIGKKTK